MHNAAVAWVVAGVLALTVAGLSVALATTHSAPARFEAPFGRFGQNPGGPFGGGSNFRGGGYFPGSLAGTGVIGSVASVGTGSFTVTSPGGSTVTVSEQTSTTYYSGRTSTSASAVVVGARVAVQGSRSGNTVTATRVVVLPTSGFGFGSSAGAPGAVS